MRSSTAIRASNQAKVFFLIFNFALFQNILFYFVRWKNINLRLCVSNIIIHHAPFLHFFANMQMQKFCCEGEFKFKVNILPLQHCRERNRLFKLIKDRNVLKIRIVKWPSSGYVRLDLIKLIVYLEIVDFFIKPNIS